MDPYAAQVLTTLIGVIGIGGVAVVGIAAYVRWRELDIEVLALLARSGTGSAGLGQEPATRAGAACAACSQLGEENAALRRRLAEVERREAWLRRVVHAQDCFARRSGNGAAVRRASRRLVA